jgi:hypothetical protein
MALTVEHAHLVAWLQLGSIEADKFDVTPLVRLAESDPFFLREVEPYRPGGIKDIGRCYVLKDELLDALRPLTQNRPNPWLTSVPPAVSVDWVKYYLSSLHRQLVTSWW